MSAGLAALAFAARGYDPERGVPFARFANARIRGALIDELRSHDWASRSVRAKARRRDQVHEQLVVALGREPSRSELATAMGVSVNDLEAVEDDVQRAVVMSYSAVTEASSVEQVLPADERTPEEVLVGREETAYLLDAVEALPERLRAVIVGYYFEDRQLTDIAADLGVTCSRASQMRSEALALMKDGITAVLAPEQLAAEERPTGRVAKRKAAYYADVARRSDFHARISVPQQRSFVTPTVSGVA